MHEFDDEKISLSDDKVFFTIEGEGEYMGRRSVFVRFSGCNLTCKGFKSPDSPHGCDSFISWSKHNRMTFADIWDQYFINKHYSHHLHRGAILKLTGGEPLLWESQIFKFIKYIKDKMIDVGMSDSFHIDFETNATIKPSDRWLTEYDKVTFTTSPKLESNGDPESKRYIPTALKWHADNNSGFKFVVQSEDDVLEVIFNYVNKFKIPRSRVWLMPCCGSRKEQDEKASRVVEWCKDYNFNYSPRLHLQIWDQALKV